MSAGAALAALLALQAPAPAAAPSDTPPAPEAPATAPRDYVDDFCAPISGGYVSGARFYDHLASWKARPGGGTEGDAQRPIDLAVSGQLMRFAAPEPVAFVDLRGGECTLVWPGAALPEAALKTLREGTLPVGEGGSPARWRPVRPVFAGRPPPPKYLMAIGGDDRGLCAEVDADLRRRDGEAVSALRMFPCRLSSGETTAERP